MAALSGSIDNRDHAGGGGAGGVAAAAAAATVAANDTSVTSNGRNFTQILVAVHEGRFLAPLADIVEQYLVPDNDALRADFLRLKRCSVETLHDLDKVGHRLLGVDLSNIVLGVAKNDGDDDWERDDDDVATNLSQLDPQIFTDLFRRCRNMLTLNLSNCNINDATVATIASSLTGLRALDLSGNKALSYRSMRDIATITTLQHLSLRSMVEGDEDENTNLCFYYSDPNKDRSAGRAESGITFLRRLTSLITLDLSGNGIFARCTWLDTDIWFHNCLPDLIATIQQVGSLRTLTLNNCENLNQENVQQLRTTRATIEVISDAA